MSVVPRAPLAAPWRLAVTFAFVVTSVCAATTAGAAPSEPASQSDADPWLAPDKALHFGVSAGIAAGGYAVGAVLFEARGLALLAGGALGIAAGITKETLDLAGLGDPSWKDLTWDAVGVTSGLLVAWGVDLLARGVSKEHPLLVPRLDREGAGLRVMFAF